MQRAHTFHLIAYLTLATTSIASAAPGISILKPRLLVHAGRDTQLPIDSGTSRGRASLAEVFVQYPELTAKSQLLTRITRRLSPSHTQRLAQSSPGVRQIQIEGEYGRVVRTIPATFATRGHVKVSYDLIHLNLVLRDHNAQVIEKIPLISELSDSERGLSDQIEHWIDRQKTLKKTRQQRQPEIDRAKTQIDSQFGLLPADPRSEPAAGAI